MSTRSDRIREAVQARLAVGHLQNIYQLLDLYEGQLNIPTKEIDEYGRKWRERNPDHGKEYGREYRLNNPEKEKESRKRYSQTDGGKTAMQRKTFKRRTKIEGSINTLTAEEWVDILKQYNYGCAYCGKKLVDSFDTTRDHIIPISKGGNNVKENIIPSCRSCNSKKSDKIIY